MIAPSNEQFSRIHRRIEAWEECSPAAIGRELSQLEAQGEDPLVISYLKLHFQLPLAPEAAVRFAPGDKVGGRYTICGPLGSGGMGVVYRATQDLTQRDVALKVIHPQLACDDLLQRFQDEIRMLARLSHPSIVQIYDAGSLQDAQGGRPTIFCTMQLVEGRPAHQFVAETAPSTDDTLRLLARICEAVQYAHDCGVVHRDLKPGNILVDAKSCPFLLDFGLAQASDAAVGDATSAWSMAGTPRYMSPELFRGQPHPGGKGPDIYALGVIAFELLTGESPYAVSPGGSLAKMRDAVLQAAPRRLSEFGRDALRNHPELDNVVAKALRKDEADRYLSAAAFGKALLGCIEDHRLVVQDWRPTPGQPVPATEWLLDKQIGTGGVGDVWLAQHSSLGQRVFKFCTDPSKLRSLKRETSLFRLLNQSIGPHPYWVRLFDVSLEDRPYYLSMEYIEGGDLEVWAARRGGLSRIPLEVRIEIVAQAAEALHQAHETGVLHCDIKPGNLLIRSEPVDDDAHGVQVCIADFGIGQLALDVSRPASTRGGFTRPIAGDASGQAGTHLYMAPEVVAGENPSISSDIYSLGVVLFQLVAGDFKKAVTIDWDRFVADPLLAGDLRRCFAGSAADRFPAAIELARSLRSLGARRREQASAREQIERRERQAYHRGILRAGAVGALIIVIVAGLALVALRESRIARRATSEARLGEALAIARSGQAGFKTRGLAVIQEMKGNFFEKVAYRNAAAALLASWDLRPAGPMVTQLATPASAQRATNRLDPAADTATAARSVDGTWRAEPGPDDSVLLENILSRATASLHSEGSTDPYIPESRAPSALAFAPDGSLLAWASRQSLHVQLWETGTNRSSLRTSLFHPAPVEAVVWLNSERLVTACQDGNLYAWNLRTRRGPVQDAPEVTLRAQGIPQHLVLCGDGRVFVSVDRQGRGIAWESDRLTAVRRFQLDRATERLTTTSQGFAVHEAGRPKVEWILEPSSCFRESPIDVAADSLQFDPSGQWLAAVASGRVAVFDSALRWLDARTVALARSVGWTPSGTGVVASVLLIGSRNGPKSLRLPPDPSRPDAIESPWPSLNRDGPLCSGIIGTVIVAQGDRLAMIRSNGSPRFLLTAPWPIDHVRLSPDASQIAMGNAAAREVRIWSLAAGQMVRTMTNASGWGEFDPLGRWWAGSVGGQMTLHDTATWTERTRLHGMSPAGTEPAAVAFTPDGERLFVLSPDFHLRLHRVKDGELLLKLEPPVSRRGQALAVAPASGQLVVSSEDGFLQAWDLPELEQGLTQLELHW